jgi:uncharacterized protein YbaR (Trm112 family)
VIPVAAAPRAHRIRSVLVCPSCHGSLADESGTRRCERCGQGFPESAGIPQLKSAFSQEDRALIRTDLADAFALRAIGDRPGEVLVEEFERLTGQLGSFLQGLLPAGPVPAAAPPGATVLYRPTVDWLRELPHATCLDDRGARLPVVEGIVCRGPAGGPEPRLAACDPWLLPMADGSVALLVLPLGLSVHERPMRAIREIARVLHPEGTLLTAAPSFRLAPSSGTLTFSEWRRNARRLLRVRARGAFGGLPARMLTRVALIEATRLL